MGFWNRSTGRGTVGGEFGARHCNHWELYGVCVRQCRVKVHDINAGRRDSSGLLQSVLMNVIGLYVSCKFGGNVKLLIYDEL